jgi:hypothetical protein
MTQSLYAHMNKGKKMGPEVDLPCAFMGGDIIHSV